ncbi:HNH endonuclease [Gordonia sp. HY285]|uniref:HNH endonuclease n=1 Tax=Gordonia liuliyuniae TaxID=2911517 RepID=A0ABS9IMZ5_9ACTN|nr:HNH endonuclease [Gordonia liuliyuniae]MCF8586924.1 HNH endonuclease [Gordonia liuliyuniae]MCF8609771.1 HNH endonuclease [Gordonia liuliyuniae]
MAIQAIDAIPVIVRNADNAVLHRRPFRDVVANLLENKMWMVERFDPPIIAHSVSMQVEVPREVILREYVYRPYVEREHTTREKVLRRDKHLCAYCGEHAQTWDHVMPQSRGGGNTWVNCVAACGPCNWAKGDRTPEEAGIRLLWEPYRPTWA